MPLMYYPVFVSNENPVKESMKIKQMSCPYGMRPILYPGQLAGIQSKNQPEEKTDWVLPIVALAGIGVAAYFLLQKKEVSAAESVEEKVPQDKAAMEFARIQAEGAATQARVAAEIKAQQEKLAAEASKVGTMEVTVNQDRFLIKVYLPDGTIAMPIARTIEDVKAIKKKYNAQIKISRGNASDATWSKARQGFGLGTIM